jgi:hypothetical protein
MLKLMAVGSVLFLSACATTAGNDAAIASWKGEPIVNAIKRWGPPDQRTKQRGQLAYSWIEGREYSRPGAAFHTGQSSSTGFTAGSTIYAPPESRYRGCVRTLYTDAEGRITIGTWTGEACCEISPCSGWANPNR